MMNFETNKQGYSKKQVEEYFNMIGENYEKLTKVNKELEEKKQTILNQIGKMSFEEDYDLIKLTKEDEKTLKELDEISEENNTEAIELQSKIEEMKKLRNSIALMGSKEELLSKIAAEREEADKLKKTKAEIEEIKEQEKKDENKVETYTDELVINAKKQADAYIEKIMSEVDAEIKIKLYEGKKRLEEADEEATKIKEEAKQKEIEEVVQENKMLNSMRLKLKEQKEKFKSEYEYTKNEAEFESNALREDAAKIIEDANRKLEMIEVKNRDITSRVVSQIEETIKAILEEHTHYKEELQEVVEEIIENERKSIA
ncbi:MAG: hypothetical protein ACK5LL_03495 [Suipraeoptans sp.]